MRSAATHPHFSFHSFLPALLCKPRPAPRSSHLQRGVAEAAHCPPKAVTFVAHHQNGGPLQYKSGGGLRSRLRSRAQHLPAALLGVCQRLGQAPVKAMGESRWCVRVVEGPAAMLCTELLHMPCGRPSPANRHLSSQRALRSFPCKSSLARVRRHQLHGPRRSLSAPTAPNKPPLPFQQAVANSLARVHGDELHRSRRRLADRGRERRGVAVARQHSIHSQEIGGAQRGAKVLLQVGSSGAGQLRRETGARQRVL